ncbi:hypothetical protein BG004_003951 [Podila humilis]|nr:hypothetical protein BG004_003951 [Podila humilis]
MSTRDNPSSSSVSVTQQYMSSGQFTQFSEGAVDHNTALEWSNGYGDTSMATASVSSVQSWASTQPQQVFPRRLGSPQSSSAYATNIRSSGNSNISTTINNVYNSSQLSNDPLYHSQHQPSSQSQRQYHNVSDYQPTSSFNQHKSMVSDTPFASPSQQVYESTPSPSFVQSTDHHSTHHGSPRMTHRSPGRKRDASTENNKSADLPSLDEYEAMLHKMTSPSLAPSTPRNFAKRSETDREARAERMARQSRKQQGQQGLQPQQHQLYTNENHKQPTSQNEQSRNLDNSSLLSPLPSADVQLSERKLRRRSSLPSMLIDSPVRLSNLKRRSSGLASSKTSGKYNQQVDISDNQRYNNNSHSPENSIEFTSSHTGDHIAANRHSWEDENMAYKPTVYSLHDPPVQRHLSPPPAATSIQHQWTSIRPVIQRNGDDADETHSVHSFVDVDRPSLEQQRKNKRNSPRLSQLGVKPPLSMKSQLRLSHTLSPADAGEVAALSNPQDRLPPQQIHDNHLEPADDSNRQIEQFQLELQQLQNNSSTLTSQRGHVASRPSPATSSGRPRAATPLGAVAEEKTPMPNAPSRQQILASMDDGSGIGPRSNTPPSRSRPTTPVTGIRLPPGPVPVLPPAGTPPSSSRRASPATGRRSVKPSPPVSSSISLHTPGSRQRAGSIASVSSIASFTMDGVLQQAPPSTPLPSLPPPPSPSGAGSPIPASQRGRKSSNGSKELILPHPHVMNELHSILPGSQSPEETATGTNLAPQVARLKKRVSTLEKELETLDQELSARVRDGDELQFKIDQLILEKDALQQKVATMQAQLAMGADAHAQPGSEQSQQFQRSIQQIQDEKDKLMTALMERKDRARAEMVLQMDSMRMRLIEKEEANARLIMEQQEQTQHTSPSILRLATSGEKLEGEVARLEGLRSKMEKELSAAQYEVQRLQRRVTDQEQTLAKDQAMRVELEAKMEDLAKTTKNTPSSTADKNEAMASAHIFFEQEIVRLKAESESQKEACSTLEREMEAYPAQLQHEEAQQKILQETVQMLTLKLSKMESQHLNEIQQIQQDHEEFLEKVVQQHANTLTEMSEQSKTDSETLLLHLRQSQDAGSIQEKQESAIREKILQDRLEEVAAKNERLENRIVKLSRAQEQHDTEMDTWMNTNKSLERRLAIEQLQQQENIYQMEQMEKENRRLLSILSGLDIAAAVAARHSRDDDSHDEDDHEKEVERGKSQYEQQRQQWLDQTEILKKKMERREEEAVVIMQKNMDLMVALEMAEQRV